MSEPKRFEARLNVYVTAAMQHKLEQLRDQRGPQVTVPDLVREAIRQYLDNEEEIIGSRRHFQRGLRETISLAKDELLWNNLVTLGFLWQLQSPVLKATTQQAVSFRDVSDKALSFASRSWEPLLKETEAAIEQSFIIKPTEKP